MAYEATVPVHRRLLWSAVTDPERLLGAVPNLTVEASTDLGVAARLRLRVGDRSITFRGIARLVELAPEQLRAVLEIEAVHGRSDGALDGRVRLTLFPAGSGTRIVVEPELVWSGHAPSVPPERLALAGGRLIPRWFDQLAGAAPEQRPVTSATLTVVPDVVPDVVPAAAGDAPESPGAPEAAPGSAPDVSAPDVSATEKAEAAPDQAGEPGETAAVPHPALVPAPQDQPSPQGAPAQEPHAPTLTLITGDAQDAGPGQKAPLRLVPAAEREADADPPAEPDLWSRGRNRMPGPLWILAAAALGAAGLAAVLTRRLLRRPGR